MLMKVIVIGIIVLGLNHLVANDVKMSAEKLAEVQKGTKILQLPNLSIQDGIEKSTFYFLKVGVKTPKGMQVHNTFVDKQTGMVFVGNAYDKEGKPVLYPIDKKVVENGISFSYGSGKKTLYVVTDPECSYCSKFEEAAKGKLDNYTVHVIFYPLPFHKKAPMMIEWIMHGKDGKEKKQRMDAVMLENSTAYKALMKGKGETFKYSKAVQTSIERSGKAIKELEAQGTPTVYDENFMMVPWKELVK